MFTGYTPLAPPSHSSPNLSSLLHSKQVINPSSATSSPSSSLSLVPTVTPAQSKKYRPPHKTEKFTPKPIPPELGHLKTYSKYKQRKYTLLFVFLFKCFWLILFQMLTRQLNEVWSFLTPLVLIEEQWKDKKSIKCIFCFPHFIDILKKIYICRQPRHSHLWKLSRAL